MKFTCEKSILNETVSNVSLSISSRTTIPSLNGVLLECFGGTLKITGYDLELGIYKTIDVNMMNEGAVVIDSKILSDILRKMPDDEIQIETDNNLMTSIRSGNTEFHIMGMSRDEYPDLPSIEDSEKFSIKEHILKNMIFQTLFAVSQNDQTPVLTGSLFDIKDGVISVVSVDGYRVAIRREKIEEQIDTNFIVPGKTLIEILKLLTEQEDQIGNVNICNKHILFEINGYYIISRLLIGEFLDYISAIPTGFTTRINVKTNIITQSIERTSIIINDRNKSPVKMVSDENSLNFSCESTIGNVSDKCEAKLEGERIKIAFNNKYMLDALKHVDSEYVFIEINGSLSPIKIIPPEGDSFLFLVLPVRLKNEN